MSRDVISKIFPVFVAAQSPSRRRFPTFALSLTSLPRGSQLDAACPFYLGTAYLLLHGHAYPFHFRHPAPFSQPPPVSPFSPFGFLSPALSIGDLLPGCFARCHSLCLVGLLLPQSITKEGNYTTAYTKLEVQPPLRLGINLRCDLPVLFADCYEDICFNKFLQFGSSDHISVRYKIRCVLLKGGQI